MICVVGSPSPTVVAVDAGPGDDVVELEPASVAGDNAFAFAGCSISIRGGAGGDVLNNWLENRDPDVFDCRVEAVLLGGPGPDFLRGTSGNDLLYGGSGRDRVLARGGEDRVRGGRGNDDLEGGRGRDDIRGGGGRDSAHGSGGRDLCRAEAVRHCER